MPTIPNVADGSMWCVCVISTHCVWCVFGLVMRFISFVTTATELTGLCSTSELFTWKEHTPKFPFLSSMAYVKRTLFDCLYWLKSMGRSVYILDQYYSRTKEEIKASAHNFSLIQRDKNNRICVVTRKCDGTYWLQYLSEFSLIVYACVLINSSMLIGFCIQQMLYLYSYGLYGTWCFAISSMSSLWPNSFSGCLSSWCVP